MATDAVSEEFITIVPVGENRPVVRDPAFVTVLTVGAGAGAQEVLVQRPRGARLGLGLKFEGGSAAAEKVRRLLVQSCAENSPAANACTPWGNLIPGDEILAIDGVSVSELTRIDCVRRLKDSDESLRLLVRHFETSANTEHSEMEVLHNDTTAKQSEIVRPTTLPPPVPPRKLGKKNSFKDKQSLHSVGEQHAVTISDGKDPIFNCQHNNMSSVIKLSRKSSFDSHIHRQNKEGIAYLRKGSPEEVRRLVRRLSDGKTMPPEAEVYIDLLSSEWERCLLLADTESDDTGSSISTVVDRLGSMASSVENSIPSTPTMQPKTIDIQKVLNCIENIDSNILKDMTSDRFLEKQMDVSNENKVEKILFPNGVTNNENKPLGNVQPYKILKQNDKNNNDTLIIESVTLSADKEKLRKNVIKNDQKPEIILEKPKPMPRSTKVERSHSERKPRPVLVPEISPAPLLEPLLTPTKKNCIETWLQRSEAEMNIKIVEKLEDNSSVPEALPRLIDFVPKPQFKECASEPPLTRPTTAPPPPPPPETREDGSGASLDTIGELDESSDVIDNAKPIVIEIETNDRKTSYERSYWEDRVNKSDAEDKSLSNDETPSPTCPRQPPDGVETPSDVIEKIPDPPSRLPPHLPGGWTNPRPRYSYTSRTQDARSEASVKDKIAMFSNDSLTSTDRLDKCGTLPIRNLLSSRTPTASYTKYAEVSSLDRRLTKSQDNLDEVPRSYKRSEVLGLLENTSKNFDTSLTSSTRSYLSDNIPLFYGSTTTLPSKIESSVVTPVYHSRSISDDNGNNNVHKSNLEYLIEQRKKSMSKLRGLVIPEIQGPIVDLPEIKVQDPISQSFLLPSSQNNYNVKENKTQNKKPIILNDNKWNANLLPNNIPKYSPAFKRKSLQVYTPTSLSKESTPERKFFEKVDSLSKLKNGTNNLKPLKSSFDYKSSTAQKSTMTSKFSTNISSNKNYKDILNNTRDYKNVEIKVCTATDVIDSDNDSAMSSTQSSYRSSASSPMHNLDTIESDSSRLSPRISHYTSYTLVKTELPKKSSAKEKSCEKYVKRNVCRSVSSDTNISLSSSAGSAATSGSQASCSSLESSVADSDKRKVSKSYNIDTLNRRNILASAKCRSGRDAKLNSPVIETKFSHESYDGSHSPTYKTSDRLSTLTASVSGVLNKGDNRRRNKKIAETDSDSDSDVNVRQRKTEFKNTRLKRNLSSGKNKQSENNSESPKSEDAPQVISEKIIKEINKAGLDNFKSIKSQTLSEKKIIEVRKIDTKIINKSEKIFKKENIVTNHCSKNNVDLKSFTTINKINHNIDKSDKSSSAKETKMSTHIVRLKRGVGTGVGLILAGGVDCEAKDVTVHRVLADSVAAKAGLKRGAKVCSINGCNMAGLTHAESVTILKDHRSEVVIEIEDENRGNATGSRCSENAKSVVCKAVDGVETGIQAVDSKVIVELEKAGGGAGLGFGLDGGRDSPLGDRPLTIKKLFAGGAAAQSGRILVGAQLLSAGGQSMEGFTRTQAWAALKSLPSGPVTLVLRNPKDLAA